MNIKAFKLLYFFIAIDNDGTLPKTINIIDLFWLLVQSEMMRH